MTGSTPNGSKAAGSRAYRTDGEALWARLGGGRDGTLWYYDAVSQALAARWPSPLTAELRREVIALLALTSPRVH